MKPGRRWIDDKTGFPIVVISAAITDKPSGARWTNGFIWIRAGAIAGGAPDDRWHGLLISGGSIQFSSAPVINGDGEWTGVDTAVLEIAPLRTIFGVPTEPLDNAPAAVTFHFQEGRLASLKTTGFCFELFSNFYDFDAISKQTLYQAGRGSISVKVSFGQTAPLPARKPQSNEQADPATSQAD